LDGALLLFERDSGLNVLLEGILGRQDRNWAQ
jgi:hypothetical protein